MTISDALMFLGRDCTRPTREHSTIESLTAVLEKYRIGRAFLLSMRGHYLDPVHANQDLFEAAAKDPRILPCPAFLPSSRKSARAEELKVEELIQRGARSTCFYPKNFTTGLDRRVTGALFRALERRRLPVILFETGLPEAADIAENHPKLPVLIPGATWKHHAFLPLLLSVSNLYVLIAPAFSLHRGLETIAEDCGAHRLLMASGFPYGEPGASLAYMLYADLPDKDVKKIAGGNMERLINGVKTSGKISAAPFSRFQRLQPRHNDKAPAGNALRDTVWARRPLPLSGITDMHGHLGGWIERPLWGSQVSDLVHEMDRVGVERAFVSHLSCLTPDVRWGNDAVLKAIAEFPNRFLGYVACCPINSELGIQEVRRCIEQGMRGIKLHSSNGLSYTHKGYIPIWEYADKHRLPVLLHTWGDLNQYDAIFQEYQNLPIILGHAGCQNEEVYVEYARKHANLFLEICHSGSRYRMIEFLVHAVGADRILFGSDIPVMSLEHAIGRIIFADISEDEIQKILVDNARRLLEGIGL